MWHGLDMARVPVAPVVHRPREEVRVRNLGREIADTKRWATRARKHAESRGTVEAWAVVLGLMEYTEHLLKRKYAMSLELSGKRK